MSKRKKIKRYGNIYAGGDGATRISPLKIILSIVSVVVLAFVGWSLYNPIYDFVMGISLESTTKPPKKENSSSVQAVAPPVVESSSSQESTIEEKPSEIGEEKTTYLIPTILSDTTSLNNAIAQGKSTGVTTFIIDIKDISGTVYIETLSPYAQGSISPNAAATKTAIEKLKAEGFKVSGKLNAFRDPQASHKMGTDKIYYLNTEYAWLDKAPAAGGKQWLNPYSTKSQEYIITLAEDACSMGVDNILLNGVQFPVGEALHQATYGAGATQPKEVILGDFVDKCISAVESKGGSCFVNINSLDILANNSLVYGSGVMNAFTKNRYIDLTPPSTINGVQIGDITVTFSQDKPDEAIKTILSNAKNLDPMETTVAIQSKNITKGVDYTEEIMKKQLSVLKDFGITSYVVLG